MSTLHLLNHCNKIKKNINKKNIELLTRYYAEKDLVQQAFIRTETVFFREDNFDAIDMLWLVKKCFQDLAYFNVEKEFSESDIMFKKISFLFEDLFEKLSISEME